MSYLVTGGARGIGLSISRLLHSTGFPLVCKSYLVLSKSSTSLAAGLQEFPTATAFQCDVADYQQVKATFCKLETQGIRLQGLVNCAGVAQGAVFLRQSDPDLKTIINTNVLGTMYCSKEALKHMVKHSTKGSIVNISSVVGQQGYPGIAAYAASKAAVLGFTKALAVEMASRGIRVNAVSPGFVQTDLTKDIPEEMRARILEKTPLKRLVAAEEVAQAVLFLLNSKDITGSVLTVDCGLSSSLY